MSKRVMVGTFSIVLLVAQAIGWILIIAGAFICLRSFSSGGPHSVTSTAAVGFILAGYFILSARSEEPGAPIRKAALLSALGLVGAPALLILAYVSGSWSRVIPWMPEAPSFLTTVSFLTFGVAMLFFKRHPVRGNVTAEVALISGMLISLLALIGYVCGVPAFYTWKTLFGGRAMSLETTILLLAVGIGLLCARPQQELTRILLSQTGSGTMARRLVLAPVLIPVVTGLLQQTGLKLGMYNPEFAGWLFSYSNLFILTMAICWSARLLYRAELVQKYSENALHDANEELERRVEERTSELASTEGRFRALVEQSIAGIYAIRDGTLVYVNPKMAEITGYTVEELTSRPLSHFIFEEDWPLVRENIRRRLEENIHHIQYSLRMVRKDGAIIQVEVYGTRSEFHGGPAILGTLLDVTQRRTAEKLLERQRRELQLILDTVPAIIFYKDSEHRLLRANQELVRLLGKPREAIEGKTDVELGSPHAERYLRDEEEIMASGQPKLGLVEPIETPEGTRWLQTDKLPYRDEDGKTRGVLGFGVDITERKRAEDLVRSLNSDLERRVQERTRELGEANKELEAFSYSVSHDLRAPLRHMGGFLQLLQKNAGSTLNEKCQRYLKVISESVGEMGTLIDDLLSFSRMGRAELLSREIDLETLTRTTMTELADEKSGRVIDFKIAPLPRVQADAALMRQVMINLLSNALKYSRTRSNTVIEVGYLTDDNHYYIFFVKDNGVGFDMKYADKLFGVFQRLHTVQEFEGTGIGLANVQRIINRHGGRTWAEGVVNQGATFYFSLPRSPKKA